MIVHGHCRANRLRSRTYLSWAAMKQRCLNPNHHAYPDYGGRGIRIAPEWMEFSNFLQSMGNRPRGKTLDRIKVNGDYCPGNCRWATIKQQNRNRRSCALYRDLDAMAA